MSWCLIILLAFVIILYFLFANISFSLISQKDTYIYFKYACFSLLVYPNKNPRNTAKTNKQKLNFKAEIEKFALSPLNIHQELKKRFPVISFKIKKLYIGVGSSDADKAVYRYAILSQSVDTSLLLLKELFPKAKIYKKHIYPDFMSNKIKLDINIVISFPFYQFARFFLFLVANRSRSILEKTT